MNILRLSIQCKIYKTHDYYSSIMIDKDLISRVQEEGFQKPEDFVRANLHYLSKQKKALFYNLFPSSEGSQEAQKYG